MSEELVYFCVCNPDTKAVARMVNELIEEFGKDRLFREYPMFAATYYSRAGATPVPMGMLFIKELWFFKKKD